MHNTTPKEDEEQADFVDWLARQGLKHTAVPNNTYTTSYNQKRKNKRLGLNPGFSDLVVLVSPEQAKDSEGYMLCVEMKRQRGGVQSEAQKGWERAINGLQCNNVQYYLAKGSEEAKNIVRHYLLTEEKSPF